MVLKPFEFKFDLVKIRPGLGSPYLILGLEFISTSADLFLVESNLAFATFIVVIDVVVVVVIVVVVVLVVIFVFVVVDVVLKFHRGSALVFLLTLI